MELNLIFDYKAKILVLFKTLFFLVAVWEMTFENDQTKNVWLCFGDDFCGGKKRNITIIASCDLPQQSKLKQFLKIKFFCGFVLVLICYGSDK